MPIIDGRNLDHISYFPIEEYIERIKLTKAVLEHLERTNVAFDNYIKELSKCENKDIINYWISLLYTELLYNQKIEHRCDETKLEENQIMFDTLSINHKRIHALHNYVTKEEDPPVFTYRKTEVNVSKINEDGTEDIFWRGVESKDVGRFMNDYLKVYKKGGTSLIYSNPFLVSSLMHLLFIRIHPYTDGNGRTARLIHNIKFTESINSLYKSRLKLSPLNLSESIRLNKPTYVKRIDNIYFDLKHNSNKEINAWFNFILDMADEQIYRSMTRLASSQRFPTELAQVQDLETKMRLSRLRQR